MKVRSIKGGFAKNKTAKIMKIGNPQKFYSAKIRVCTLCLPRGRGEIRFG
jgi:hypothetical protein